jgi:hypothetical protein
MSYVNVTVQNSGSTNVSGLTLTVRLLNNKTEVGEGYTSQINNLLAGESREFSGRILYGLSSTFSIEIRVKLGNLVLAECVIGSK